MWLLLTRRVPTVAFVFVFIATFLANVLRYVRYMLSAVRLSSVVCRLSSVVCLSVCDVGAPYSGG